jgi:hypothetical protein
MIEKIRYIKPKVYGSLGYKSYFSLTYSALDLFFSEDYRKWNFKPFYYYEFGTGEGNSLKHYLKALKDLSPIWKKFSNLSDFRIFLFDSFEGLPEYSDEKDKNFAWSKVEFKGTVEDIKNVIERTYHRIISNVTFIKGYYEETLTERLIKELSQYPPSLINIDVDYYKSAKIALNFVGKIAQEGTIVYFDDIYEYLGNPTKGELAAIEEYNRGDNNIKLAHFRHFNIPSLLDQIYVFYKPVKDDPDSRL